MRWCVLSLFWVLFCTLANAQDTSSRQRPAGTTTQDTLRQSEIEYDAPTVAWKAHRASMLAAVLPGAGQIYNGQYWKLGIVYGAAAFLGYSIYANQQYYSYYRDALRERRNNNSENFNQELPDLAFFGGFDQSLLDEDGLRRQREFFRRNRDLLIISSVAAYGLTIVDATVFAHLKDFKITNDLSLSTEPFVQPHLGGTWVKGARVAFHLN